MAGKRKLIEAKLGELIESFIMRRLGRGQGVRSLARELSVAPGSIRYYRNKAKRKGHVDICLCPHCVANCRRKVMIHTMGRCVMRCVNYKKR